MTGKLSRVRKMIGFLKQYRERQFENSVLVNSLMNGELPSFVYKKELCEFYDETLNESQRKAVMRAKQANHVYLIHGPPGTGKTKTLAELVKHLLVGCEGKILLTSPSNTGVDNLLKAYLSNGGDSKGVIRIGNPSRADKQLSSHFFDSIMKKQVKADSYIKKLKQEIHNLEKKLVSLENKKYVNDKRKELKTGIREKNKELEEAELVIINEIFNNSKVIATTLTSIYDKKFQYFFRKKSKEKLFEYAIIDEAAQALNSLTWIAVLHSKRLIMAGDHKQLPPTIKADSNLLTHTTLFERLIELSDKEGLSTLLNEQYRMNRQIMQISNTYLYDNKLTAAEDNSDILIPHNPDYEELFGENNKPLPLFFVDTASSMFGEDERELENNNFMQMSKANKGEAEVVVFVYQMLRAYYKLEPSDIGVITPYSAQVSTIKSRFEELMDKGVFIDSPEVSTVDGFQGREKEVIIISTVRSNKQSEIGFLSDERRMNVAITRAKRLLCFIGNSNTIENNSFLSHIICHLKKNGACKYPIDFDQEGEEGYKFAYSNFHMSGVFKGTEYKPKTTHMKNFGFANEGAREVAKKKKKKKKSKPMLKDAEIKKIERENQDDNIEYHKQLVLDFLGSDRTSMTIYRKLEYEEYGVLEKLCNDNGLSISKNKKPVIIEKPKPERQEPVIDPLEHMIVEPEIISEEEVKPKKKKRKKKKKKAKPQLTEEEQEQANLEFIMEFDKNNQEMKDTCHHRDENNRLCGKNIKLHFSKCTFCDKHYCIYHGIPETHGCGIQAMFKARNKEYLQNKDKKSSELDPRIKLKLQAKKNELKNKEENNKKKKKKKRNKA